MLWFILLGIASMLKVDKKPQRAPLKLRRVSFIVKQWAWLDGEMFFTPDSSYAGVQRLPFYYAVHWVYLSQLRIGLGHKDTNQIVSQWRTARA